MASTAPAAANKAELLAIADAVAKVSTASILFELTADELIVGSVPVMSAKEVDVIEAMESSADIMPVKSIATSPLKPMLTLIWLGAVVWSAPSNFQTYLS